MPDPIELSIALRRALAAAQNHSWQTASHLMASVRAAYQPDFQSESYEQHGRALLLQPLEEFERTRPIAHSLTALETFDLETGEGDLRDSLRRAPIDGAMQAVLGKALLSLPVPWLISLSPTPPEDHRRRWNAWCAEVERLERDARAILARFDQWATNPSRDTQSPPPKLRIRHDRHLAFFWRRQRSVAANLELAAGVYLAGLDLLSLAGDMIAEIERERQELLHAIKQQIHYLEHWNGLHFDPPPIQARIMTREERAAEWWSRCNAIFDRRLPQALEVFSPVLALPTLLDRPHLFAPRAAFHAALIEAARPVFRRHFTAVMENLLAIAQEIERAGEVIRYAEEASKASEGDLLPEAVANVTARLRERAAAEATRQLSLHAAITPVILRATHEAGENAGRRPTRLLALQVRRRGAALLRESRAGASGQAHSVVARLAHAAVSAYDTVLVRIGWKVPVRTPIAPVLTRPALSEVLDLDLQHRHLPALYLRLFRLAPVDDPRFLIGRGEELDGFRQALAAWNAGRYAACLLVGARGSGKTSLLNCALPTVFSGQSILRGQLHSRLTEPADLDQFLLNLLGGSDLHQIAPSLASTRRVIVLEEVERVFLKKFGGFSAARRLLEIVHDSASTTLWILVLNAYSARLLNEAVGWNTYFSHTINSMSVWREDLERAILQRHNLSGLKLAFAAPQEKTLRARLGIRTDPHGAFFDSLYEQSGGNFRSAFELWQSSIELVEGGTVHMRQPLAPDLALLRNELRQQDHFTLLSILQHGSLTPQELAQVLLEPENASRLRIERLSSLGILEPDPDHPGLRIDPEAHRLIDSIIQNVNLA